ncbi:Hypothetical protein, putative [Bodo saltans]|uniref:SAM domain-containing protein n=1 Tax=Bodo saltans TaxID=75058 RepID=A0A0S4J8P1_BODSA|nr:Hypothetical protein, putative [Bodo saltans]|eukprot:CUG87864.1 Hypothetical protein, putative [Bodo saltans]
MDFVPKKEFTFYVEKKNAIGLWVKKFCVVKDNVLTIYDSEKERGGNAVARVVFTSVNKVDDSILEFKSSKEALALRICEDGDAMYGICHSAAAFKRQKIASLVVDPRFGLQLIDVPQEYISKFANLDKAVLYWFSVVKKFGSPSKFTGKMSVEDRISFCGDKAFYVTKGNGEVTRCVKIQKLKQIVTNVGLPNVEEQFVVLKFASPEYDVCIASPTLQILISSLQAISYSLNGVQVDLRLCGQLVDAELQLERPSNFSMTMVLPTTKEQLKKALIDFGKKHQISFSAEGISARVDHSDPRDAAKEERSNSTPSSKTITDPLESFLTAVGCHSRFTLLYSQNVDLDILECMDETDLRTYGITDVDHISRILDGLRNGDLMAKVCDDVGIARKDWSSPRKHIVADQPSLPRRPQIILDSDEESDVAPPRKVEIVLDSDEDDVVGERPTAAVILDDDDL